MNTTDWTKQELLDTLTFNKCRTFTRQIHETQNNSTDHISDKLQELQSEFKLKMWHDHSDILNHSYVSFMTFLYDPINFLTDEEYHSTYPEKPVNVQSVVERPKLYIFGILFSLALLNIQ
jgi:hypothetical protein